MKKFSLVLLGLAVSLFSPRAQSVENPMFSFTHMLPSPFTLPAGRLVLGTQFAYGLTDFLQIGTDVFRDFYKIYNANAKVSLLDFPEYATALTLGFEHYNYKDIDSGNPDLKVTSWQPGAVTSLEVMPYVAWFFGGHLNFSQTTLRTESIKTSGLVRGYNAETDLSWAYNPHPKKKSMGNVLSGGVTYDFSYKIYGVGISHHWPGFHVGVHYYPNASKYKLAPILAGGAVVDL